MTNNLFQLNVSLIFYIHKSIFYVYKISYQSAVCSKLKIHIYKDNVKKGAMGRCSTGKSGKELSSLQ